MALILGHRGASSYAPDNTRVAFKLAMQMGADGVETDVHLTADGIPVIQHNYDIDRNSDGHGDVEKMTLEELRKYDFGSWKGEQFKGEKIMTLDEFLALAKELNMKFIDIELKFPEKKPSDIVEKTIELVKKHELTERVMISSFDHELLIQTQQLCPEIITGALYDENEVKMDNIKDLIAHQVEYVDSLGCDFANPHFSYLLDPDLVTNFTEKGIGVCVWTVDKPYVIHTCMERGVKAIVSNRPDIAVKAVSEFNER